MTRNKKLLLIAGVLALSACSSPLDPSTDSSMVRGPDATAPRQADQTQSEESVRGQSKPTIDARRAAR